MAKESYINFVEIDPNPKTRVWQVVPTAESPKAQEDIAELGEVKWFGRWRRYAFFPQEGTIYEQSCLRKIADFCEGQTQRRATHERNK